MLKVLWALVSGTAGFLAFMLLCTGILLGLAAISPPPLSSHPLVAEAKSEPDMPVLETRLPAARADLERESPPARIVETPERTVPGLCLGVSLVPAVDSSGYAVLQARIGPVKSTPTDDYQPFLNSLGAFDARLSYGSSALTVTKITVTEPFAYGATNLNAGGSTTYFNAFLASATGPVPPLAVAELRVHLKDGMDSPRTVMLDFVTIADNQGEVLEQETPARLQLLRGDADNDGAVTIKDAMAIAQYLAGGRASSTEGPAFNPVNAASVHPDGPEGDRIDIKDAMEIAQRLAARRG